MRARQPVRYPTTISIRPRKANTVTFPELFSLPVSIDLTTAASALGIHVNTAYKLIAEGRFPCPVLRVGWKHRVPTMLLLKALGIEQMPIRASDIDSNLSRYES